MKFKNTKMHEINLKKSHSKSRANSHGIDEPTVLLSLMCLSDFFLNPSVQLAFSNVSISTCVKMSLSVFDIVSVAHEKICNMF